MEHAIFAQSADEFRDVMRTLAIKLPTFNAEAHRVLEENGLLDTAVPYMVYRADLLQIMRAKVTEDLTTTTLDDYSSHIQRLFLLALTHLGSIEEQQKLLRKGVVQEAHSYPKETLKEQPSLHDALFLFAWKLFVLQNDYGFGFDDPDADRKPFVRELALFALTNQRFADHALSSADDQPLP